VAALAALVATLVVPAWGHLADELVGRVRAFRIGLVVATGCAVGLLFQLPLVLVAALVGSFTVFANLFIGLSDALAVADLPAPERQYGALRAYASLSFTIGIVAVGFLYSWAGYGAAPAVFLLLFGGKTVSKIFGLYPVIGAFKKLNPRDEIKNLVMFVVWLGSIWTTVILLSMAASLESSRLRLVWVPDG